MRTVWAGDLAPDDTDLGSADLLASAIDESDLLSEVEIGALSVLDTLNLDERGTWGGGALATLVAQVATPDGALSVSRFILSVYRVVLVAVFRSRSYRFAPISTMLVESEYCVYSLDIY